MACQTLNAPPAGVTAYLVAGSSTTMLAEGLPEGARLEFAASADGPVLLSLEGVVGDAATAFEFTARQVDDLIARAARYVRIVTGDGDTVHVLAAGRVWERSGWSGECGRAQTIARLIAGPPGPKGDPGEPGADGRGVESITDDDEDGIATVLYTDGATGALPLPRGPQGDPAPMPEIAWAGDVLTVDGVSSPPLSGPAGPAPTTSWSGTSLIVGDNPPVDLRGPVGARGPVGSPGAVATASDFLLVGPGRPDTPASTGGIITGSEPVGCEYRSTDGAGVGAWVWMKKAAGWEVTHGDTGWRDLPAPADTPIWGFAIWPDWRQRVRRIGKTVIWFPAVKAKSNGAADAAIQVPSGFLPEYSYTWLRDGVELTANRAQTKFIFRSAKTAGVIVQEDLSTTTNDPWPTSLPGTPA